MSGFEIDLDEIEALPGPMRTHQDLLTGGSSVPSPDTGVNTTNTRDAIDRVVVTVGLFAADLGVCADGLDGVVDVVRDTDGQVNWVLDQYAAAAFR